MYGYADPQVIEERDEYRAVIIRDEYPLEPDHDGQGYVFRVEHWGYRWQEELVHKDYGNPEPAFSLAEALDRFGTDWQMVERYLRMFHDVVAFDYADFHRSGPTYVLVVTRAQVEEWGLTDVSKAAEGTLGIWEAWATGDTWAYVIERRMVTEHRTLQGEVVTTTETWMEEDRLYGYYGEDDATESALHALDDFEPKVVPA